MKGKKTSTIFFSIFPIKESDFTIILALFLNRLYCTLKFLLLKNMVFINLLEPFDAKFKPLYLLSHLLQFSLPSIEQEKKKKNTISKLKEENPQTI